MSHACLISPVQVTATTEPPPSNGFTHPLGVARPRLPQASAVAATRELLSSSLAGPQQPSMHLHQSCHSQLQALVGSNTAALVAFNLGYLPGGDKALTTHIDTTTAAVEAALEVRSSTTTNVS